MPLELAPLPSDPDELRRFAAALQAELYSKTLHIEKLKAQLAVLRRARFGKSSEKINREAEQLELLIGDLEEGEAENEARQDATATGPRAEPRPDKAPRLGNRKPLPEHLPREIIAHPGACVCPACGSQRLRKIADEEREVLEYVPSHFKVLVHQRPKLTCRDCEAITQPADAQPADRAWTARTGPYRPRPGVKIL